MIDGIVLQCRRGTPPSKSKTRSPKIKQINSRSATHSGAANDSNSLNVHRRESCLATVQIKLVGTPRHAAVCAFFVSASTLPLPFFRLTSLRLCVAVRRYSAIALRLGGALEFFGLPPLIFFANNKTLQQASAHPCSSRWDRGRCDCSNTPAQSF
jgi:hypothetical protein